MNYSLKYWRRLEMLFNNMVDRMDNHSLPDSEEKLWLHIVLRLMTHWCFMFYCFNINFYEEIERTEAVTVCESYAPEGDRLIDT